MTISFASVKTAAARPKHHAGGLTRYIAIWKQRRALAQLSDALLRDLGITRAQAAREAARSFWDIAPK